MWLTISVGAIFSSLVIWLHYGVLVGAILSVLTLVANVWVWGTTVTLEGLAGNHLAHLQSAFKYSFGLFLLSEAMFFFAIFWVYLDAALNPAVEVGGMWPSVGIVPLNPFGIPLLNTVVLLSSGVTATYSHYLLMMNKSGLRPLLLTLVLALMFEVVQYVEFSESSFSISDGIFGSIFFFGTGFHGLHVILGHLFLMYNAHRIHEGHFTRTRHISFELALVYWHFVDVIWVILFTLFYWWIY